MSTAKQLSPEALGERWEVSPQTLERWRSDGLGPRFLKIRGRVRYRLEDIEAFELSSLRQSTGETRRGEVRG